MLGGGAAAGMRLERGCPPGREPHVTTCRPATRSGAEAAPPNLGRSDGQIGAVMAKRHRFAVLAGGASCVAALTGLVVAGTPGASAHPLSSARAAQPSAQTPSGVTARPPIGRPKSSGSRLFNGPADTASPWTPLENPPPFGTPGTMLLESDGTVLVHNEPDNNTTGGTNAWWKLTPDSHGSYADGTWSQIASMPAAYSPLYFASAVLPDGRMIVEGGEYIGENPVWSNQGEIYDPVTDHWTSVAPPP